MGWFSRREPVYSPVGDALHRLMTTAPQDWRPSNRVDYVVFHEATGASVYPHGSDFIVRIGDDYEQHNLTADDISRLRVDFLRLYPIVKQRTESAKAERLLRTLRTPTFDDTARSLALAVLNDDKAAAKALVDYLQENPSLFSD